MRLTTKGRYGLRVMMELAMNEGRGPVLVDTIAKNQDMSGKYIHVLVTALRNAGMVRATRGPNGGYELAMNPNELNVLKIVETLEGKTPWVECLDDACICPRSGSCAPRDLWQEVVNAVDKVLSGCTLADLADKQRAKQLDPLMFYI